VADWNNKLYFGDNLDVMREEIADESVDLIYLDPPFNSNASYNVLFKEKNGSASPAQIKAFEDTWHWDYSSSSTYQEIIEDGPEKLATLMESLHQFLGPNDMFAYLVMMAIRLEYMRRILKNTGSIYLHCDPTASHYLKLVMDAIFGVTNYRNEVVWQRYGSHNDPNRFGRITDTIFFYTKSDDYYFAPVRTEYSEEHLRTRFNKADPDGRRFWPNTCLAPGGRGPEYEWNGHVRHWRFTKVNMAELDKANYIYYSKSGMPYRKNYLDELKGQLVQNLWTDIKMTRSGSERLGYPTQKPEALLERIVEASCPEGGVVLDPFCGCGTTIAVAEHLHRLWIGIDVTHLAITLMISRLQDTFGEELEPYEVHGLPTTFEGAKALATDYDKRFEFQFWALGLVGARPRKEEQKKGKDKGIDGIIRFFDDDSGGVKKIIVSVKSGKVKSGDVRDLKGTMEREKAVMGAFITLEPPTKDMKTEAVEAGFYKSSFFEKVPRIQILTIKGLLNGTERLEYYKMDEDTFQKAKRQIKDEPEQGSLLDTGE